MNLTIYCKPTIIRDFISYLRKMNWFVQLIFGNKPYQRQFFLTTCITIWLILVHGKKYLQQWGSRKDRGKFSLTYKSWLTVCSIKMVEQDTDLTGRVDREQGGGVNAGRRGQVDDRPSPPLHHSWYHYTCHLQSASILL